MLVCATTLAVLLVIGGMEKNPRPGVEAENVSKFCVAGATEILNQEINVTLMDSGSTTAAVML